MRSSVIAAVALVVALVVQPAAYAAELGAFSGGPLPPDPAVHIDRNEDYEPAAAVAPDGSIWISASVLFANLGDDPRAKGVSGEDIWRSRDGGRTFEWIADPADLTGTNAQPGPGGGDVDIATATAFNPDGTFNVYAVTGWGAGSTVSISRDSGKSWTTNPIGTAPIADRQWVVGDGRCVFYVTHKQFGTLTFEHITRYDVCDPTDTTMSTTLVSSAAQLSWTAGRPAVDVSKSSRYRHSLYVPVIGCTPADSARGCSGRFSVDVHVSRDGGRKFKAAHVGDGGAELGSFPMIAVDALGTLYMTWGDRIHMMFAVSRDGGATWHVRPINTDAYVLAMLPQIAASQPGEVALAWYGTRDSKHVKVYVARSRDGGRSFAVGEASPTVYEGLPCLVISGDCGEDEDALRDNFAIVINPRTDKITVAYTSNQPQGKRVDDFVAFATEG